MKNLLVLFVICLFPHLSGAAETQTKKELNAEVKIWCKTHIDAFNTANYDKVKATYHFPCSVLNGDEVKMVTADGLPLVNFAEVKATGWAYSKIRKIRVLSVGSTRAMVGMTFSRVNGKEEELLTTTSFLGLTKVDGKWGLKTLFLADDITLD